MRTGEVIETKVLEGIDGTSYTAKIPAPQWAFDAKEDFWSNNPNLSDDFSSCRLKHSDGRRWKKRGIYCNYCFKQQSKFFSAVMMYSCWMFELMETNIDPSVWSEWRTLAAQKDRKLGIGAQGA